MFENLIKRLAKQQETIQVEEVSNRLVPSLEVVDGQRRLFLNYQGRKHLCTRRAWESWAERIFIPDTDLINSELIDEYSGTRKRWSTNTVRRFLEATPIDIADKAIKSWWERYPETEWHIVKYADNGQSGSIRYVGSNRYRLYKNIDFVTDLSAINLEGYKEVTSSETEDLLFIRIAGDKPFDVPHFRGNLFPGFHILNSENGSSSVIIRYFIYDLICTNGLIMMINKRTYLGQKHVNFEHSEFREKVRQIACEISDTNLETQKLITGLANKVLNQEELQQLMSFYEKRFSSSGKFVEKVLEKVGTVDNVRAWTVLSAITEVAQTYSFDTRLIHEENAGHLAADLIGLERWRHNG